MNQRHLLFSAISQGELEAIENLLGEGCNPDLCDSTGRSALLVATEKGQPEIIIALVEAGANPEQGQVFTSCLDASPSIPLQAISDSILAPNDANDLMLRYFDNVYESINGVLAEISNHNVFERSVEAHSFHTQTPLQLAIENGDIEIVDTLIAAGARVCFESIFEEQPLVRAIKLGHYEIAKLLLEAGALEIEFYPDNPLVLAAKTGNLDLVKSMLNAGAVIHDTDQQNTTPLEAALTSGHHHIAHLLRQR